MKLSDYLSSEGISKSELAKRLGVSRGAVSQWVDIPEGHMKALNESREPEDAEIEESVPAPEGWEFLSRNWRIKGEKLIWQGGIFGHGSDWDYNYSPARIFQIRRLLKDLGSVAAVLEFSGAVQMDAGLLNDIQKDIVCPIVVDMMKVRIEGGRPVPKRVYPFGGGE